jgi:hypothetical protein
VAGVEQDGGGNPGNRNQTVTPVGTVPGNRDD